MIARPAEVLLAPDEPPPFERLPGGGSRPIVVVCDHASNRIPRALAGLGLPEAKLGEHIAYDIGAAGVARALAACFGAPAVLGGYSRLVVDLNRNLRDPSAMPAISDGTLVPGNLGLDADARAVRVDEIYAPYHEAVADLLESRSADGRTPLLVAVHSFTPTNHGVRRPWHFGVLWDKDPRLAIPLMQGLRARGDVVVGDNEPYSGRHPADYTIDHHAEPAGIAHAAIEIRQDLITDEPGQRSVAERLAAALAPLVDDASLYRPHPHAHEWSRHA